MAAGVRTRSTGFLSRGFAGASRLLRHTPLRRVGWVNELHGRWFARLFAAREVRLDGCTLEIDPRDRTMRKKLMLYGGYEPYLRTVMAAASRKDSAVIDAGACFGLHSVHLAHCVGPGGRVFAFEPDPDNFAILTRNVERNGLGNVSCHPLALGDRTGSGRLYQSDENRGNLSLYRENVDQVGELAGVPVPVGTGDELLRDLSLPVSLLKVDVEGAEPAVLRGLAGVLVRNPQAVIIFEFSPHYIRGAGGDAPSFLAWLESLGYAFARIDEEQQAIVPIGAAQLVAQSEIGAPLNVCAARGGTFPRIAPDRL